MLYAEKQKAIKAIALDILKSDKPSKRELNWFLNTVDKYKETDDIWVTHKLD